MKRWYNKAGKKDFKDYKNRERIAKARGGPRKFVPTHRDILGECLDTVVRILKKKKAKTANV